MTNQRKYELLVDLTSRAGWKEILLEEAQYRFDTTVNAWMNTPGQTTENIHKAAGIAASMDWLLKGIDEEIKQLAVAIAEDQAAENVVVQ